MISTYGYFGIIKNLIISTLYYISGYTPENQKKIKRSKHGYEFDNSYQGSYIID